MQNFAGKILFTSKPSSFLLLNSANYSEVENELNLHRELFHPHVKLQIGQIPIEIRTAAEMYRVTVNVTAPLRQKYDI